MLDLTIKVWDFFFNAMEMSPFLVLGVFVIVEFLSALFNLKESKSRWRDSVLGVLCLICGVLLSFLALPYDGVRSAIYNGIILGSVSAISYQIIKPAIKLIVQKMMEKINREMVNEG